MEKPARSWALTMLPTTLTSTKVLAKTGLWWKKT